jgi:hypothetical protein
MPQKTAGNAHSDALIAQLRARGLAWETIAFTLGQSSWAVVQRGVRIGLCRQLLVPDPDLADPAREPLRAGHPLSWGPLCDGTLLEGSLYPWPPVLAEERPAHPEAPVRPLPLALAPLTRAGARAPEALHAPSA